MFKNGKAPLSKKAELEGVKIPSTLEELFEADLVIPKCVKADLKKQELDARWIDRNRYLKNGGNHKRGYRAYQVPADVKVVLKEKGSTLDPDGFLRRNTMILGVRPLAKALQHKAFLRREAQEYTASNTSKKNATQIRERLKQDGLGKDVKVTEGYENN